MNIIKAEVKYVMIPHPDDPDRQIKSIIGWSLTFDNGNVYPHINVNGREMRLEGTGTVVHLSRRHGTFSVERPLTLTRSPTKTSMDFVRDDKGYPVWSHGPKVTGLTMTAFERRYSRDFVIQVLAGFEELMQK